MELLNEQLHVAHLPIKQWSAVIRYFFPSGAFTIVPAHQVATTHPNAQARKEQHPIPILPAAHQCRALASMRAETLHQPMAPEISFRQVALCMGGQKPI